jgi:protein-disulfide isomerase
MHRFMRLAQPVSARTTRVGLFLAFAAAALFAGAAAHAQFAPPEPGTQVHDPAALRPPAGARVAIVEFEDLECPDCSRANVILKQAATTYHIPWIRHDFPLPFHNWSLFAAVNARWFDKLLAEVKADYALGQRIGIEHTPTIWVVTANNTKGAPFVEVVDRTKLFQLIDEALAQTTPAKAK